MSEWISVNDRLPEINSRVLACLKLWEGDPVVEILDYEVINGEEDFGFFDVVHGEEVRASCVTHWIPIPKLPEGTK